MTLTLPLFFESVCPEDVLLTIFEMISSSDVKALCFVTRGVHGSLQGPPDTLPTAWARAARSKLRKFLPAGPIFGRTPLDPMHQRVVGPLGERFPGSMGAVEEVKADLYATLAQAIGVPQGDVSLALNYTFGPALRTYPIFYLSDPHKLCCAIPGRNPRA